MNSTTTITAGMPVYGADARLIGPVESQDEAGLHIGGHHVPREAISRIGKGGIYLKIVGQALLARHDRETEIPADRPSADV